MPARTPAILRPPSGLTFFCAIRFGWRDVGIKILVVQKAPSKEWESPRTTGLLESQYRSAQGGAESQSGASREGCTMLFDSMTYAEAEVKDSCFECGRECAFQTDADGQYVCGFPAVAPTAGPACRIEIEPHERRRSSVRGH